jgi:hypothetical protein
MCHPGIGFRATRHNWFLIPFGIVFTGIGIMNAVDPRLAFRMRMWQFKNTDALQPSDAALVIGRVMGVIAIIIGITVVTSGFLSVFN